MANETAWKHFQSIRVVLERLDIHIKEFGRDIDVLKAIKEEVLDNAELKAELKKIVDIAHDMTMESLVADYTRFQALKDWLEENEF